MVFSSHLASVEQRHRGGISESFLPEQVKAEAPCRRKRMCRVHPDGKTEPEAVHELKAPVLINFVDQGSAAWPGRCYCHYAEGMRFLVERYIYIYIYIYICMNSSFSCDAVKNRTLT